ncbi:cytochrome c oxidase subunit 3 [Mucilaginibacter sp. KACC 22063]|uniref:cytochrome c oxidase subunit 3 n=1 Tax=Mucilaginibacter sp. KACC 22063 TaxID=3025666 RepID=UPI002366AF0A|nr:cytochrome c oxidase subunit 3 [Mucilaginibacter sp. KACC 22063]WDF56292.1 cytochrome c oxidase subunit 3 [Mucilaginibacter sp. KACC 22063]
MMAQLQQEKERLNLAPKKFNLWIFLFTSFMLFMAFTSGFIVYTGMGKGHELNIQLPNLFIYSTAVILLSSATMFMATKAAKGLQFTKQRAFLWATMILGVIFFVLQVFAWGQLVDMRAFLINPNASISFVYVMTGAHLLHIFAGLVLLINSLRKSYRSTPQVMNVYSMDISSIFWHFVDIIWIYLYVFLLLNQR